MATVMDTTDTTAWQLRRLGVVMEPDMADPYEVGGVLNPAVTRGPDGQLYLLPRLVAAGNYSRIGLARVLFSQGGTPVGVERLGVVLEPQAPYELNPDTGGGVEDPRVTYIAARRLYVMTYTAFGPTGPRIAAAVSRDLAHWRRLGLVRFAPHHGLDLGGQHNKDAVLFPEPVRLGDRWLVLYHGVSGRIAEGAGMPRRVRYCVGALLLDGRDPRRVLYRSARSLLVPQVAAEREGVVPRVVFPTGLDARPDG